MTHSHFRQAFEDELARLSASNLTKVARILAGSPPDRLVSRLVATSALSSGALHGAQSAKAGLTGDYGPEGSLKGALSKGALGGLIAALGLKGLGRLAARGRVR